MLENIVRHVENGDAAACRRRCSGSREMGFTIISISVSLVAVFIPIFFMPGVIGLLFHEFAVVVGIAVLVSAVVSLTLVPMLASRYRDATCRSKRRAAACAGRAWFERGFDRVLAVYERTLDWALQHRRTVLGWRCGTFVATAALFIAMPKGFFPERGHRPGAGHRRGRRGHFLPRHGRAAAAHRRGDPRQPGRRHADRQRPTSSNSGRMFMTLKPRGERPPIDKVVEGLRKRGARDSRRQCLHQPGPEPAGSADASARAATST